MVFNDNTKEEIRDRIDIAEVIGRYVTLKPAGQNLKGLCPFHKEKTPSFTVNPSKGIFHCFGCGKGGDIFTFLMELQGIPFVEVLQMLAEETGVKLERRSEQVVQAGQVQFSKSKLQEIHEIAARYYYSQIQDSEKAVSYFKSRELTAETVREFRLGYAPAGWSHFTDYAASKNIGPDILIAAGLAVQKTDGRTAYDRFRDRIIFPICDISGRTIGFGGRAMTNEDNPKYLNSPETLLYRKNKTLYGLHKSRAAIKEHNTVLVVEGYMDYLALYQAGITHCVAVSGTALTVDHGQILRRFTPRMVLIFDGDSAGISAAERSVFTLARISVDIRVLILPSGEDPDSFIKKHGADEMRKKIELSCEGIVFVLEQAVKKLGGRSPQEKSAVINHIVPILKCIPDQIIISEYIKIIAERLGVAEHHIYTLVGRVQSEQQLSTPDTTRLKDYSQSVEGSLFHILLHNPRLIEILIEKISVETLTEQLSMKLYSIIIDAYRDNPKLESLVDRIDDSAVKQVVSYLLLINPWPPETAEQDIQHIIRKLEIKSVKTKMRSIRLALQNGTTDAAKKELLEEHKQLSHSLKNLNWT